MISKKNIPLCDVCKKSQINCSCDLDEIESEDRKIKQNLYYQKNKDKFREYNNRPEVKKKALEHQKNYRIRHPEKFKEYQKTYKDKNKERFKEYQREYREKKRKKSSEELFLEILEYLREE